MAKSLATEQFESLRRRYQSRKARRSTIENEWDEIEKFTGPLDDGSSSAQGANGTGSASSRKDVWDLTAIEGREKLASRMHGSIVPSSVRWFQGSFRKASLNKLASAVKYRDELMEEAWSTFSTSDFYTETASLFSTLCGPGNGFLFMEPVIGDVDPKTLKEMFEGLDFGAIPLREGFFEPDRKGDIRVFWRRHMWTPAEIYDHLLYKQSQAVDDAECAAWAIPEDIQKKMEQGNTDVEEIVLCIFPREKVQKRKKMIYPAHPQNRPWGSMWWREQNGQRLGTEGGYYERPIYFCPWAKTPGTVWGHGPGNVALPTVKYVNAWKEQYRLAGEIALEPPFLTEERNNVTDVDIRPGRGSVVRSIEGMKPFVSGSNFQVAESIIQEDIQQIRTIFRMDDLQLKESPAMTATEVQVRYEIMNQLLGKTLTNIQTFLLGPIIRSVISILVRVGRAPKMPTEVEEAGGAMAIEYQGPLARSQRTDEVAAVERWVTMVYGMAQFEPRMRAAIDPKRIASYVRERLGIPADLAPTEQEMDKRMKEIDEMQARAMAADAKQKEAKATKDTAQASAAGPVPGAVYPALPPAPYLAPSGEVARG